METDLKNMSEDEIRHPSDVIGDWGPIQRNVFLVVTLVYFLGPFQNKHIVFTAPKTDFTCIDNDLVTGNPIYLNNACYTDQDKKCTKFEYDKSWHKRTLVTEFDLVCGREWLASFSQSMHQIGYAVSGVVLGAISDRYGRFFCAKISIILEIVAGFGQAYAPSIYFYMFARFFVGVGAYGRFLNGYILLAEWVGPKVRGRMAAIHEFAWSAGKIVFPIVHYLVTDYFAVQIGLSSAQLFLLPVYVYVVCESPKWLLTRGKYKEAEKILTKAATAKGVYSDSEIKRRIELLRKSSVEEQEKLTREERSRLLFWVWKDPKLLRISLNLYFFWWSRSFIGHGFFYNIGNLGGNIYLNVFIMGWSGIFANLIYYYSVRRFKRRTIMIVTAFMKALLLCASFASSFHDSLIPLRIILSFFSTIFGIVGADTLYLFTTETFPTPIRQVTLGVCSVFSRLGSVVGPFMKDLTNVTHLSVSFGLFSVLAILNAILLCFLPDTTDIQLPDNILQTKEVVEKSDDGQRRKPSVIVNLENK